jgi:hypothetical protein
MGRVGISVAVGLLIGVFVPPVQADVGDHCSYRLVTVLATGTSTDAELELVGCYDTYEEALEEGSGGALQVPSSATPASMTRVSQPHSAGISDLLIGTEWDGKSFAQASNSYFAAATCSALITWQVPSVGATWNDEFESGKGFGGCDTNKKFEHVDFGGAVRTCTPNCADYMALANEVSSLRWKP